jgi:hypothetical protein
MKSNPEAARVEHLQGLLLPLSPHQMCDHLRLNWWAAMQLHTAILTRLLAGLEKPYCYRPNRVYYDWASHSRPTSGSPARECAK